MSLWIAEQRTVKLCESGSTMKKAGRRPARDKDCIFISVCRSAPR